MDQGRETDRGRRKKPFGMYVCMYVCVYADLRAKLTALEGLDAGSRCQGEMSIAGTQKFAGTPQQRYSWSQWMRRSPQEVVRLHLQGIASVFFV